MTIKCTEALNGDEQQASIFTRRFTTVCALLSSSPYPPTSLLLTSLILRAHSILQEPSTHPLFLSNTSRRALRTRGISDYYYSQLCVLTHTYVSPPSTVTPLPILLSTLTWKAIETGLQHASVNRVLTTLPCGPISLNLLLVNPSTHTLTCHDVRSNPSILTTSSASVSGGFFLYSESPILTPSKRTDPVGFMVSGGEIVNPPIFRRGCISIDEEGGVGIERVDPVGWRVKFQNYTDGNGFVITSVNGLSNPGGGGRSSDFGTLYNRGYNTSVIVPSGSIGYGIVGSTVVSVSEVTGELDVPLNGCVVITSVSSGSSGSSGSMGGMGGVGERVEWVQPEGGGIIEAMAGGPMLVKDGEMVLERDVEDFSLSAPPVTFSQDKTFDSNLLPRMSYGVRPDGTVLLCAVDGRDVERPGMTLEMVGEVMKGLGCKDAVNMDGGSSKRMIVKGEVVDNTSTEVRGGPSSAERGGEGEMVRGLKTALVINRR